MKIDFNELEARAKANTEAKEAERTAQIGSLAPENRGRMAEWTESINRAYEKREAEQKKEIEAKANAEAEQKRKEAEAKEAHARGLYSTEEEEKRGYFKDMLKDIEQKHKESWSKYEQKPEAPKEQKPKTMFEETNEQIEKMRAALAKDRAEHEEFIKSLGE